jgi:hypothetical protein
VVSFENIVVGCVKNAKNKKVTTSRDDKGEVGDLLCIGCWMSKPQVAPAKGDENAFSPLSSPAQPRDLQLRSPSIKC